MTRLAVIGATGAVGRAVLALLAERKFPLEDLYLLASERSSGEKLSCGDKVYVVQPLAGFDFSRADIAIFSAGGSISAQYAPIAAEAGCMVIDNTAHFRYDADVPLVIPEINPQALKHASKRRIIANPNCSTIQMLVALKPIYDVAGITRINVATYQSVSGAGAHAVTVLKEQTASVLQGLSVEPGVFPVQIAFNVIPQIDVFLENGYTKEEMKMVWETHKIFEDDTISVNPTAVRVPVLCGHAEAIHLETREYITADAVRALLEAAPGVNVIDERTPGGYPTPAVCAGTNPVYVGRIRNEISCKNGINLWVVADNVRKGAALNAIQIAEKLLHDSFV